MKETRLFQGIVAAFLSLGLLLAAMDWFLVQMGEIDIGNVVDRQFAAPQGAVLFSSGINQHAYQYKMRLLDRIHPSIVAIGSSRAMQVRGKFFNRSFVNLGGAVNDVAEFELAARDVASVKPELALVFVDPWWFNSHYSGNAATATIPTYPRVISADLIFRSAASMRHAESFTSFWNSPNLGIFAKLVDEGFERDGSYNYLGTISGAHPTLDWRFHDTLERIRTHTNRFEEADAPDPSYVRRMCAAVAVLRGGARHVVLIAPPLSSPAWRGFAQGRYGYVSAAYGQLQQCAAGSPFFNVIDPGSLPGSTDCEFVDGFHGGDVTYARILRKVSNSDSVVERLTDKRFLDSFIDRYSGMAGGMTLIEHPRAKEIDFLGLGCAKKPLSPSR